MENIEIETVIEDNFAKKFCEKFIGFDKQPKYLMGRNVFAQRVMEFIDINGFIDDFTDSTTFMNKPIVRIDATPKNALVLVLSARQTKTAIKNVKKYDLECLDYFSFVKYSGLKIIDKELQDKYLLDFNDNKDEYNKVFKLLSDSLSKKLFYNLINFRCSYDIKYISDFEFCENKQYFENFAELSVKGEVFVDIGGYDGFTTLNFIKRFPEYSKVFFFEPDKKNIEIAKKNLISFKNIFFFENGLSNRKDKLKFNISGSASTISNEGKITVDVDRLDSLINEKVTYLKLDIEGHELQALEGASKLIKKYHPKLAVSVYHLVGDFWKIPKFIFSIRKDYIIYLRHYTESIDETVMYFIPK